MKKKIALLTFALALLATPALAGPFQGGHGGGQAGGIDGTGIDGRKSDGGPKAGSGQCNRCGSEERITGRMTHKRSGQVIIGGGMIGPVPQGSVQYETGWTMETTQYERSYPTRGVDGDGRGCACKGAGFSSGNK